MSSVRAANRRASGVPGGRVRPRAVSMVCISASSARGASVVSTATTQLRYQDCSPALRPGSISQGSES